MLTPVWPAPVRLALCLASVAAGLLGGVPAAKAADLDPMLLMLPATLAVSYAFMLPVATPPNAIVCGSGHVRIADMFRVGIVLDLVGVLIITLVCWGWMPIVFGTGH